MMSEHISESHLFQHINHTLDDAEQEIVNIHLNDCDTCCLAVEALTAEHQMIFQSLQDNLRQISPSPQANFAAIAPKISSPKRSIPFTFLSARNAFAGGLLLAILIISVLNVINIFGSSNDFGSSDTGTSAYPILNGNFELAKAEDELFGWILSGTRPQDYEVRQDHDVYFEGNSSALLTSVVEEANGFGRIMQTLQVNNFMVDQRIRLSMFVKTENVDEQAGLYLRIDGENKSILQFDNMVDRPIMDSKDWQLYEIVLDVPPESETINLGVWLEGNGRVWIDNAQLEVVSKDIALTGSSSSLRQLTNPDFEEEGRLVGWGLAGSHPQDYQFSRDKTTFVSGEASALLTSKNDEAEGFSTLVQGFSPENYLGQRVKLSASIKTENVKGWVGMWMRVDKNQRVLKIDNMRNRAIHGTNDWDRYEIVLDIPPESTGIALGLILGGPGKTWIDNITLERVDLSVPTTDTYMLRQQPVNLSFEAIGPDNLPTSWYLSTNSWQDFELHPDANNFVRGKVSASLDATEAEPDDEGAILQAFDPTFYLGKRVQFTAYVKTVDVSGWSGLWMSVGQVGNEIFQFDNMQNRPITGTTDWTKYEIVLDMPAESERLEIGVYMMGNGRVWIDDATFKIIDDNTPSTHCQECLEAVQP